MLGMRIPCLNNSNRNQLRIGKEYGGLRWGPLDLTTLKKQLMKQTKKGAKHLENKRNVCWERMLEEFQVYDLLRQMFTMTFYSFPSGLDLRMVLMD